MLKIEDDLWGSDGWFLDEVSEWLNPQDQAEIANTVVVWSDMPDRRVWKHENSGDFSSGRRSDFSVGNALPVSGRLILQQDQNGLPTIRLKRLVVCDQRQGIG
ncbi:unnamed protein product [Ilex paraguariensis]|uniref:Uncharacterized protein n=1 Tax=Ilex paraguariensis TaxID=185542 RepID=A0ABC8TLL8_9AQUA